MKTYKRICISDYGITDGNGKRFEIKRGQECITSKPDDDGYVVVMGKFWIAVPVDNFAGEKIFTGGKNEIV